MSSRRILRIVGKDLHLGPRSPVFLWVLVLPLLITFVVQVAFGTLFDPQPRLGVVDEGSSSVAAAARDLDGVRVVTYDDAEALRRSVEANDLDAGLVLPEGFDEAVRSGARPPLEFFVGGESLASNRIILAVTAIDLIRGVEGSAPPVDVAIVTIGDEVLPLSERLVPFVAVYALLIAGVFLPSFSLADERERRTLQALLVSPTKLSEVVAAKGIVGFGLAVPMAIVTLWLNGALTARTGALVAVLVVAALMLTEIGLIYGMASKGVTGVFTLIKGTGVILLAPTLFYIFPSWPQWIARLFPTYWVIDPVRAVTIDGARLADVAGDLAIALAVIAVLVLPVVLMIRRLRTTLAIAV